MYVAFNAEEFDLAGSREFVKEMAGQMKLLEQVHVLEMVGYRDRRPNSQKNPLPMIQAPTTGDFLAVVANKGSLVDQIIEAAGSITVPVVGLALPPGLPLNAIQQISPHLLGATMLRSGKRASRQSCGRIPRSSAIRITTSRPTRRTPWITSSWRKWGSCWWRWWLKILRTDHDFLLQEWRAGAYNLHHHPMPLSDLSQPKAVPSAQLDDPSHPISTSQATLPAMSICLYPSPLPVGVRQQVDRHLFRLVVLAALVLFWGGVHRLAPQRGAQPCRDMSQPAGQFIGSFPCFAVNCVSASCRPRLLANTLSWSGAASFIRFVRWRTISFARTKPANARFTTRMIRVGKAKR